MLESFRYHKCFHLFVLFGITFFVCKSLVRRYDDVYLICAHYSSPNQFIMFINKSVKKNQSSQSD